ncbi:MAG: 16S rRNA (uracil(1498)-N(3))-methyltransferase [Pseudomonadota bacterium]
MGATPAWPPRSTPRLYVAERLAPGPRTLDGPSAHYLLSVLRAKPGDPVKLFDDATGEWLAVVSDVARRTLTLDVRDHLSLREAVPDLWLCFAPLKKGPIDFLVEKACELGVARLVPVVTRRTIVDRIASDRLRANLIEAAEQCGRTALPELAEPVKLAALLRDWDPARTLFFADEEGGAPAHAAMAAQPGAAAILIGPEGGFDAEERALIRALPQAQAITLGPRILRAETAAAAALSVWMTAAGDW